ncbi:YhgE/Pip domain-containing protein [Agromyces sp. LHK192]|uniref:YhgE/Pip domain-containing protein n=1 Tax=Agromyces sp. LHK192 TaxID=2498704 RepID=UPI000FD801D2|nr:YhgE/Pip domain-containing protein [Agromyces sp. LHK192]
MSTRLQSLLGSTPKQRRIRFGVLLATVLVVPLAVAGLFSGALGGAADRIDAIPAVVVNDDEMVTTTTPDGEEQMVLAGRLLVTELTGDGETGFDWSITNDEDAAERLASGEAYAVLTIPSDFSASITSMSGTDPERAGLTIRTDDAHGYLAGSVAQSVGTAMSAAFGQEITAQYLEGFYANLAGLGGSLGDAADGAAELSSGAGTLAGGVGQLSDGLAQASSGATDASAGAGEYAAGADEYAAGVSQYASGVTSYTEGVDGIASGLGGLSSGAKGLDEISAAWDRYTGGISQGVTEVDGYLGPASDWLNGFVAANPDLVERFPELATAAETVTGVRSELQQLSTGGQALAGESRAAIDGIQGGIDGLASGAAQLSGGSAQLRDGASGLASGADQLATGADALAGGVGELASGLGQLSTGASEAASGATQLSDGATQLADGLAQGADGASALTDLDAERTADVVSNPVGVDAERDNEISSIAAVIGMLFVPIGLWLGALALFLVFPPLSREALRSTASTPGLVGRTLARAAVVGLVQAVAVVLLLHTALGVTWAVLPQTLAFAALLALVFTALHAFLTTWLGRMGVVVSLVLVALQLTATGGLYPIELVSGPFQAISPLLPLTWAVQGMQAIVAGASGGVVAGAAAVLALFGAGSVALTMLVVARRRGIRSTGLAAATFG